MSWALPISGEGIAAVSRDNWWVHLLVLVSWREGSCSSLALVHRSARRRPSSRLARAQGRPCGTDDETTEAVAETFVRTSGGAAIALTCDVGDRDQLTAAVRGTVEQLGPIDVVFYNAVTPIRSTTEQDPFELDDASWTSALNVNLRGAAVVAALTIPSMLDNGRGSFVFTSSSSSLVGEEVSLGYGVFKAGLNALTRFIASRYGRQGVRANTVFPFVVQGSSGHPIAALTCLGRSGTPEEVGEVVAFLCSDRAGAVTGQMIHVDCGLQAKAHWPSAFVPEAPMAQLFGLWDTFDDPNSK